MPARPLRSVWRAMKRDTKVREHTTGSEQEFGDIFLHVSWKPEEMGVIPLILRVSSSPRLVSPSPVHASRQSRSILDFFLPAVFEARKHRLFPGSQQPSIFMQPSFSSYIHSFTNSVTHSQDTSSLHWWLWIDPHSSNPPSHSPSRVLQSSARERA